jgi:hypothetical protein
MLSGETTNTNYIVFGMTRPGLEPTIYCTNHFVTVAVNTYTEIPPLVEDLLAISGLCVHPRFFFGGGGLAKKNIYHTVVKVLKSN